MIDFVSKRKLFNDESGNIFFGGTCQLQALKTLCFQGFFLLLYGLDPYSDPYSLDTNWYPMDSFLKSS